MAETRNDTHVLGVSGTDRLTSRRRRMPSPAVARCLFRLRRPAPREIAAVARANASEPYSYERIGGTSGTLPSDADVERESVVVGHGPIVFNRAMDAVRSWCMFHQDWIDLMPVESPPRPGQVLAFASRQWGIWTINACRIVYVMEPEEGSRPRYGFAYGTLSTHAVSGEERFLVDWDRRTDEVRFEVAKFSRPAHPLIGLLSPLSTHIQQRFTRHALEAVRRAVQGVP